MSLNTKTVLSEINRHILTVEKAVKKDQEFEAEHEAVLNLCRIVFDRKSDYKKIDMEYPNDIIINIQMFSGEPDQQIPNKTTLKDNRQKLAADILETLRKVQKLYLLKVKLEK